MSSYFEWVSAESHETRRSLENKIFPRLLLCNILFWIHAAILVWSNKNYPHGKIDRIEGNIVSYSERAVECSKGKSFKINYVMFARILGILTYFLSLTYFYTPENVAKHWRTSEIIIIIDCFCVCYKNKHKLSQLHR